MKTHPILFSAPMIRALLDGSKSQTRRLVKIRGVDPLDIVVHHGEVWKPAKIDWSGTIECPYGQPGDTLWVRETWCIADDGVDRPFAYRADNWVECPSADGKWKPSIFCTRAASRITLEITAVRVERLNDISEEDAKDEGVVPEFSIGTYAIHCENGTSWEIMEDHIHGIPKVGDIDKTFGKILHVIHKPRRPLATARDAYWSLWGQINGFDSWTANPWVWVIQFRRIKP